MLMKKECTLNREYQSESEWLKEIFKKSNSQGSKNRVETSLRIFDMWCKEKFSTVFTGMGGRFTRLRIICAITEEPKNPNELSKKIELDYKTVIHNIGVLEKNGFVTKDGNGYGATFFPSILLTTNLSTLYVVIRKVEAKFDRKKSVQIE